LFTKYDKHLSHTIFVQFNLMKFRWRTSHWRRKEKGYSDASKL